MNTQEKQKGFTLIELLIVISIISLLSSFVLVAVNSARAKSRDAVRYQAAKQIKNALELYYTNNGYYPLCGADIHCDTTGAFTALSMLAVVPTYISSIKNDPLNTSGYGYYYGRGYIKTGTNSFATTGNATDYIFGMRLENGSDPAYTGWGNPNLNYLDSNRTQ